jgi:hypothetical protein
MAKKFLNGVTIPTGSPSIGKVWMASDTAGNGSWGSVSGSSNSTSVASIAALQAISTTTYQTAILTLSGREAVFTWNSANLSTLVTADPNQGIYVAPASDTTGASGAWVRKHDNILRPEWFGTVGTTNDAAVLQACINLAYTISAEVLLSRMYTTTTAVNIKSQTIKGQGVTVSGIFGNHTGNVLAGINTTTEGMVLDNFQVKGNGTTDTNGASTGLAISSTLEETSHISLSNMRFYRHSIGIVGGANYSMFDSVLTNVDFWACSNYGEYLGGSQVMHTGCTYRVNNWGVLQDTPAANSVGGGTFEGCTWIQNGYDIVLNSLTVRPLRFIGCWFEQSKTMILGRTASGQFTIQSIIFESCLFQPGATSVSNGVLDIPDPQGIIGFMNCIVFKDLYASATLPLRSYFTTQRNIKYQRTNCQLWNGTLMTKLADVNDGYQTNQSTSTPAAGFASDTYLAGSMVVMPSGGPEVGSTYRCVFSVSKTAVGTAAPVVTLRTGLTATTSDTSRIAFTFGAGTTAADVGIFEVIVSFRSVGTGTAAVLQGMARLTSNLAATGLSSTIKAVATTSAGFDSTTAGTLMGLSYNGGTSAVHTVTMVRAELLN